MWVIMSACVFGACECVRACEFVVRRGLCACVRVHVRMQIRREVFMIMEVKREEEIKKNSTAILVHCHATSRCMSKQAACH